MSPSPVGPTETTVAGLPVVAEGPPDGRRIVLVHGSMDRMTGFAKVARRLSDCYRVVRYDRRGYGRSVPHAGPFTVDAHVDDLEAVVLAGAVGGDPGPVVLVGHSFGGNVVLAAAERLGPERVAGVAVFESPMSWTSWWPGTSAGATAVQSREDPADIAEAFMARMVGRGRWERLPAATREARRAEGVALVGELTSLHQRAPWHPEGIRVPVVVGRGSLAREHHQRGTETMASSIAGARLVTLESCGHLAHTAHPERFTEELVRPLLQRLGW